MLKLLVVPSGLIKWVCQPIHTHTNKISGAISNHQADSPLSMWPDVSSDFFFCKHRHFTFGLMSALVNCKLRKEYGHTWRWISLLKPGVTYQHKHIWHEQHHRHKVVFAHLYSFVYVYSTYNVFRLFPIQFKFICSQEQWTAQLTWIKWWDYFMLLSIIVVILTFYTTQTSRFST